MNTIIETFKELVVQIATPYSTGTGFYLQDHRLIVTNEHVVRDNRQAVIHGQSLSKQLADVVYLDEKFDLAFLKVADPPDLPSVKLANELKLENDHKVLALGHPFGRGFESREGRITSIDDSTEEPRYLHHNATLNAGNSGGPLVDEKGVVVGINTFIVSDGNDSGFSLPAKYLEATLADYQAGNGKTASRCFACSNVTFEGSENSKNCSHCGAAICLPSMIEPYESAGAAKTIEQLLEESGHDIELSRSGHLQWEIQQGSAKIDISYYDKTGLIIGDAYLCKLPSENQNPLYEFLLRQNYEIEGLTFSIKGQYIVLSLLINDRYLNTKTGKQLLNHLFERADYYDNVLVEQYGANWIINRD